MANTGAGEIAHWFKALAVLWSTHTTACNSQELQFQGIQSLLAFSMGNRQACSTGVHTKQL